MNQKTLQDKVVIITGGSSGIGKACAETFGKAGAKVVITGRNNEKLVKVSDMLNIEQIDNLPIVADSSVESDCKMVVKETIDKYGKIDVLINNAGISMRAMFAELDLSVIERVMQINFFGTVYITKFALPYLTQTQGSIVGVSSIAGFRGLPGRTGYSASKFAMQGFLESLRTELLKKNVNVLVAAPGFTSSNIRNAALVKDGSSQGETPRDEGKMMSSEEVSKRILNAVVKRKRSLVLTRQGKLTVLLNKLFPGWMDQMVYNTMAKEKDSPLK
ncbi:SDR family oxidoreductase [Microscilla marina]|uniref:Short-chain dehydrogenase/reductase SDR n=1 Tax=Microscilla marina ATCC 23134 TaxID=313606 RepID=A1ZIV8_MICM2|nr:SDR family oxidoreductase [Microscilla marina]EAY29494.1 short-chain dehydrogenase/reductase SDR [Microscilla marina ATCC 23134]